jgi:hypothetical protein
MGQGCGDLTDIRQRNCGRGELTWQYPRNGPISLQRPIGGHSFG